MTDDDFGDEQWVSDRTKRTLTWIGFAVVLCGVAYGMYLISSGNEARERELLKGAEKSGRLQDTRTLP